MEKNRYLAPFLKKDLKEKILILSGPRQAGKTTLAKMLSPRHDYLNYYAAEERLRIDRGQWDRGMEYVIFDELHVKKDWKKWLKALFEKEGLPPGVVVTGSARLETLRKKTGDSLAGCFFPFRLHPFDLKEIRSVDKKKNEEDVLDRLLKFGGFPEPYLKGTSAFYNRWQRSHTEAILREDVPEFEKLQNVSDLQTLLELLKNRTGSCINHESLGRDLQRDGKTVKRWLTALENFYVVFKVLPYHKNINKSLRKQAKYYFYDTGLVKEPGAAFENLVACSLLKKNHFREDCYGERRGLYYLRDKSKREVDFLVTKDNHVTAMIEAKWSESELSPHFEVFSKQLPEKIRKVQVVKELKRETTFPNKCEIRKASRWLANL